MQTKCCKSGGAAVCNKPWYLDRALSISGNLNQWAAGTASPQKVRSELTAGRPVCCRILWGTGPLAHFVVLDGCSGTDGAMTVYIRDPKGNGAPIAMAYNTFVSAYETIGKWVETNYVKP
jgi:hypothetical protein